MRIVLQRVKKAKVEIEGCVAGKISKGLLIFLGIGKNDTREIAEQMAQKVLQLRIFEDDEGKMNIAAENCEAEILVVSQFTLYGNCSKGRRPSFENAASPQDAKALYDYFVDQLMFNGGKVETGEFGAMMDVELTNDGPVTFVLES